MNIDDLRKLQISQDESIGFYVSFDSEREKYEQLTKDLVGLFGEIGEFSNIVKKINLKLENEEYSLDINLAEKHLKEEWVDTLIYLLRISAILNIDIEDEAIKKINFNKKRYEKLKRP